MDKSKNLTIEYSFENEYWIGFQDSSQATHNNWTSGRQHGQFWEDWSLTKYANTQTQTRNCAWFNRALFSLSEGNFQMYKNVFVDSKNYLFWCVSVLFSLRWNRWGLTLKAKVVDKLISLAKTRLILQNRTYSMELKPKLNRLKLKAKQLKLEKLKLLTS